MDDVTWHYAVWKGRGWHFMLPACVSIPKGGKNLDLDQSKQHGMTINRGDVNCQSCKTMMGMVK